MFHFESGSFLDQVKRTTKSKQLTSKKMKTNTPKICNNFAQKS